MDNIVSGPLEDSQEMAGLNGFVELGIGGRSFDGLSLFYKANIPLGEPDLVNNIVIDLSKVPASAIVKPEPKTETGWTNVYDKIGTHLPSHEVVGFQYGVFSTKEAADSASIVARGFGKIRIACVEITFKPGDGL